MSISMMWTLGHMDCEQNFHWPKYEYDGKKWFPPHLVMCKASWWKSGPHNHIFLTSCDWGLCNVLPITTFISIKQNFHSIKSKNTRAINPKIYKNDQWKGFIGFKTILSVSEVIFYHQFFYILLKGQILGNVPLHHNMHIPLFTLQKLRNTSMGGCMQFQLPPSFGLHA